MKYFTSILFLLILSCNDKENSLPNLSNFSYPLSIGNSWIYSFNISKSLSEPIVNEMGEIIHDGECNSFGVININISDFIEINNELQAYKMIYSIIEDVDSGENCINDQTFSYYINNSDEGLIYYAMEQTYTSEMYGLPLNNNINEQIINQLINGISQPIIFNLMNRNCIYYFEPPATAIEYPIQMNNHWIGLDDNTTQVLEVCENSSNYLNDGSIILNSLIDQIIDIDGNCFTVNESGNILPDLANDLLAQNTKTYCKNIGLINFSSNIDLGEQTSTDEFGNNNGTISISQIIEWELIDYTLY